MDLVALVRDCLLTTCRWCGEEVPRAVAEAHWVQCPKAPACPRCGHNYPPPFHDGCPKCDPAF